MEKEFWVLIPEGYKGNLEEDIWNDIGDIIKFTSREDAEEAKEYRDNVSDSDIPVKIKLTINAIL